MSDETRSYSFAITDPALLAEINAVTSNIWTAPDGAYHKGDTESWSEPVEVVGTSIGPDPKQPLWVVTRVDFQCAPDAPPHLNKTINPNAGRRHSEFYRIAPSALGNKGDQYRQMTVFSLSGMQALARAGHLLPEGGTDPIDVAPLFQPSDGLPAPIVGVKVYARVRKYKDKQGTQRMELARFVPLEV